MTQQEMQIAIAEACRWTLIGIDDFNEIPILAGCPTNKKYRQALPFNSLDSMQQAVLAQDEEFQKTFGLNIYLRCPKSKTGIPLIHQLTFLDWQTAFVETLKALGRLK